MSQLGKSAADRFLALSAFFAFATLVFASFVFLFLRFFGLILQIRECSSERNGACSAMGPHTHPHPCSRTGTDS